MGAKDDPKAANSNADAIALPREFFGGNLDLAPAVQEFKARHDDFEIVTHTLNCEVVVNRLVEFTSPREWRSDGSFKRWVLTVTDPQRLKSTNTSKPRFFELRFQIDVVDPKAEIEALLALGGFDNARVLEIGCGNGRLTFCYEHAAHSVLAIDPSAEAIAKARERLGLESAARVRFEVDNALELGQPPASFDVALLSHSL
jgi:hypothetical protein